VGASRDADAAYREYAASNPEWAWRFRVLEGEVLVSRGLSTDSLALLDAPIPASLAQSEVAVRKEMFEGLADCTLRRFDEADRHLSNAGQLAEAYQQSALAEVFLSRGTLAFLRGDYSTARSTFRQALQLAQRNQQSFIEAKALGSLGLVAMYEERYDESIDWYTRSLDVSRSLGAQAVTAKTLGNMGWCYHRMGDDAKALSLSSDAKEAATQLGVSKDEMLWLRNIGIIEDSQGSYTAAERDYEEALDLANKMQNGAEAATCLNNLAIVKLKRREYDRAEQYNRQALALKRAENDRVSELYSLITEAYIAAGNGNYEQAKSNLQDVTADKNSNNYLQWQAEAGLAYVYVTRKQPVRAEEYFQKAMATIEAARSSLQHEEFRLSFVSGVVGFYDDYISFLVSQGNTEKALEVAEFSHARTLAEGLGINSSAMSFPIRTFKPRQTAKQSKALVLDYWLGAEHSYLWVITPARVELFRLPPAAEIDPLVQSYRQALLGSREVLETQNAAGQKLYDLLVAPAAKMIPKGARVTILPDGSLYGLNFETLLAPAPQLHYWIEDVDVSYANSLTLLAAGASRHAATAKKLLLVGDAVSPDPEFPKLPQAAAEMTGIENYFSAAERTVFSGAEATPDSYLKSQPADFSYIHFVAHGTASRTSPLDSAVILSRQGDDYKLYARDIIQHPLHADLVTISACHGEGVRTYSGEGLVGLSWAFLRAGAHGVIAALWEVNDNSTPQVMDHLYSEIGTGVPPDAALRDAKLALLHSGGVYRRPFYWAPFELYHGS
jgi:CHAT domain-containing protein/Tfp pilus assembly protein PilF